MIRLACALGEVFDLFVLDGNFRTKKSDLAIFFAEPLLELIDVVIAGGVRPRLFASGRKPFVSLIFLYVRQTNGRVRSRPFASVRLASLHDHRYVSVDGGGGD